MFQGRALRPQRRLRRPLSVEVALASDSGYLITVKWRGADEPTQEQVGSGRFGLVTNMLKASAPEIPIATCLTPSMVLDMERKVYEMPPEVDWLSYDNYHCWAETECAQGHCCWQNRTVPPGNTSYCVEGNKTCTVQGNFCTPLGAKPGHTPSMQVGIL